MSPRPFFRLSASIIIVLLLAAGIFGLPASRLFAQEPVISVAGSATYAEPGTETHYYLELLNHTDEIVYDGVLTMTLPPGFTYVPGSTLVRGEGWPLENAEPVVNGQTLTWGPYNLPAAGITAHNPYGIHTLMHDCQPGLHLDGAKTLVGNGGYVKQMFYGLDTATTGPSDCAVNFVNEAYARNLIPILRLQGHFVNGVWQKPSAGPDGDYSEIAQAYARYVAGLPRRNTNPLYIEIWNEPDLWIEWNGRPNATQYARFFVAVSRAIKQLGDARIRVLNGALTPGNMTFLRQMLNVPGFKNAFDAWSVHCYPYNHPASYNIHNGTARYSTYAIDCYIHELNVIKSYGRRGVKVIISETGYELGSNTFGFEGYSRINESNRAGYIASAFADYWQKWPEVIAVTPFQMADTDGQWANFDWIYPTPPFEPHLQYTRVSNLTKPVGRWQPYGYQVTFRAVVSPTVVPGDYPGILSGSERSGHTALDSQAAPVKVMAPGSLRKIYLPIIAARPRTTGPWYLSVPETASPGAIVPTHFAQPLTPTLAANLAVQQLISLALPGAPQQVILDEPAGWGAVSLTDPPRLQSFHLNTHQLNSKIPLDSAPQWMTTNTPRPGQIYVSLKDGLVLIDLACGTMVRRQAGLGRLRGIARDERTERLFVADAEHDRLLVLSEDLSTLLAALPLPDQPDRVFFDPTPRRIYIAFPGSARLAAIDADTLEIERQIQLTGGPVLDVLLDSDQRRLYVLNALAPTRRGITVLETPSLRQVALIAGTEQFPLQRASAIALIPGGELLISEIDGLWQLAPLPAAVSRRYPGSEVSPPGGLAVAKDGTIYALDAQTLKIYR